MLTRRRIGVLLASVVLLTGCPAERAQTGPIHPTLESLATAMIDTANRGDWAAYQDCFTFAEAVEFPADLTSADQRPWSQVEDERQWLRGKIQHPTQPGAHLEFLKIAKIEVKGRRTSVGVATRQQDASIAIITLDAVMTDSGWRFIPVRNP